MPDRRIVLWAGLLCGCPTPLPSPVDQSGSDSTTSPGGTGTSSSTETGAGSTGADSASSDSTSSGSSGIDQPLPVGGDDEYCLLQGAPDDFVSPTSLLADDGPGVSIAPESIGAFRTREGGTVTIQEDGHFTYVMPDGGVIPPGDDCEAPDNCTDSFSYRIRDVSESVSDEIDVTLRFSRLRVDLADLRRGDGGLTIRRGRQTGVAVSPAGDVNGDGVPDLLVGSHRMDFADGVGDSGRAAVIFGGLNSGEIDLESGDPFHGFFISGQNSQMYAGYGLADAGDVDRDGYDDVIVSATGGEGMVFLVYGDDSESEIVLPSDGSKIDRAYPVVRGGDDSILGAHVDVWREGLRGTTWLISSALRYGDEEEQQGAAVWRPLPAKRGLVSLYDIDDPPIPGAGIVRGTVWSVDTKTDTGFEFGSVVRALAPLGDGGLMYVAVTSDTRLQDEGQGISQTNSSMRGRVHVVPAEPDVDYTMDQIVDEGFGFYMEGEDGDRLGRSIAVVDLDGDGTSDIAIGAPGRDYGTPRTQGMVYVLFGGDQLSSKVSSKVSSTVADLENGGDRLLILGDEPDVSSAGYGVSGAGDFNRDGIDDLIVGAPSVTVGLLQVCNEDGRVYVIFGGEELRRAGEIRLSDIRNGIGGFTIGEETGNEILRGCLGWSVADIGDVAADEYSAVIIGAPAVRPEHNNQEYDGRAYVVQGFAATHPGRCPPK